MQIAPSLRERITRWWIFKMVAGLAITVYNLPGTAQNWIDWGRWWTAYVRPVVASIPSLPFDPVRAGLFLLGIGLVGSDLYSLTRLKRHVEPAPPPAPVDDGTIAPLVLFLPALPLIDELESAFAAIYALAEAMLQAPGTHSAHEFGIGVLRVETAFLLRPSRFTTDIQVHMEKIIAVLRDMRGSLETAQNQNFVNPDVRRRAEFRAHEKFAELPALRSELIRLFRVVRELAARGGDS